MDRTNGGSKSRPIIINKNLALSLLVGFVIGVIWLAGIRFAAYKSNNVHYHANFALYINGQRDQFKSFTFYEEVQSCYSDDKDNPKDRVHMHDNVNSVVHVHAPGVTWGHFFANIGYTLGDTLIKTDQGVYVDGQNGHMLRFILNGKSVENIANQLIKSDDTLLVDYGNDSSKTLQHRYDAIPQKADSYNDRSDPSSCSGSKDLSLPERLKKSFW